MQSKSILTAICTFILLGCTDSSKSNNAVDTLNDNITEQGSGRYLTEKSMNYDDPEWPKANNCTMEVDARLKPGMNFISQMRMNTDGVGFAGFIWSNEITSVAPEKITSILTIIQSKGLPNGPAGLSGTQECVKAGSSGYKCESPLSKMTDMDGHNKYLGCTVKNPTDLKIAYTRGKYTLDDQSTVRAYQTIYQMQGVVSCDNVDLGVGQIDSLVIQALDVPSSSFAMCEQVPLSMFLRVVIANKTMKTFDFELKSVR